MLYLQVQRAGTCVVHRQEALLHEQMLQVVVVHRDFSHHIARHKTGEAAGLAVIEPIGIFVPKHLSRRTPSVCCRSGGDTRVC